MTMNRIPLYLALTFVSRTGFPTEYHQFTANFLKKEERFFRRPPSAEPAANAASQPSATSSTIMIRKPSTKPQVPARL
ncbi:hypothetical protein SAMN05216343_10896 [Oscillibacter sp. PC13]|nr:hypothetical protein SAMN05216343_10896 [Oscillibacter sp. PC13]